MFQQNVSIQKKTFTSGSSGGNHVCFLLLSTSSVRLTRHTAPTLHARLAPRKHIAPTTILSPPSPFTFMPQLSPSLLLSFPLSPLFSFFLTLISHSASSPTAGMNSDGKRPNFMQRWLTGKKVHLPLPFPSPPLPRLFCTPSPCLSPLFCVCPSSATVERSSSTPRGISKAHLHGSPRQLQLHSRTSSRSCPDATSGSHHAFHPSSSVRPRWLRQSFWQ